MRLCAVAVMAVVTLQGQPQPWYQTDFPAAEFRARWAKLYDKIGSEAVAVVQGVSLTPGFNMPRQSNEFLLPLRIGDAAFVPVAGWAVAEGDTVRATAEPAA